MRLKKQTKQAKRRDDRKLKKGKRSQKAVTSFPSGHSAGSIATARAFSREFREYSSPIGAAATVAAAQVPKCTHYITDVVAGLAVGLVAETVVDLAWDRFSLRA